MPRKTIFIACLLTLIGTASSGLGTLRSAAAAPERAPRALSGSLTVFDWLTFEAGPKSAKVLADYRRMHPGVTIKILPMPPGDPTIWEESVLAAGSAPDLLIPPYALSVFSDLPKHYWLNLTPYLNQPNPYVKGNKRWLDLFNAAGNTQVAFVGNQYYVVPNGALDCAFYYNKDIFAKVGITHVPTTWAELMADSARIKAAGYIPDLQFLGDTYPIAENGSILSEFENQVMSKTFQRLDTDHNGVVDIRELVYGIKHRIYSPMNADYQEAWKLYKDWSPYWQPNAAGNHGDSVGVPQIQLFVTGKAAMMYAFVAARGFLNQDKVKFHWGVFKFPQVTPASSSYATPGEKGVGIWGAWNAGSWAIPATTKTRGHLALALDFLQWFTAPQNVIPANLESGAIPDATGWQPTDPFYRLFGDLINHPTMQFAAEATLGTEWLKDRIAVQQKYILGMESLGQAMAEMQRYTDQAADRIIKIYHFNV
jgi:ABC-type glycerol-3-phosphate transport system substrate-binding protein